MDPDASFACAVVGGGPAGLRAAEVIAAAGGPVAVWEQKASVGRKFLVAGRGGLNLTHSESAANFPPRYRENPERWASLLADFPPEALRAWAHGLGVETYVGTSGRVFPRGQQAARLLRAWVSRLRATGVTFRVGQSLQGFRRDGGGWELTFACGPAIRARAVVLALGGASWPETGSDGRWPALLAAHDVEIQPWLAANGGWEVEWPEGVLAEAEGQPLKNLAVAAGGRTVRGELLVTRYGLEGGALYQLSRELRSDPHIVIDFKPDTPAERDGKPRPLKLSPAAAVVVRAFAASPSLAAAKAVRIPLRGPRPIEEAISSAGGVAWPELDEMQMLRRLPGVFVAGEMIDWEAPTGGYLLQGCFATGDRAGRGVLRWLETAP